jgi:hypothetical protein
MGNTMISFADCKPDREAEGIRKDSEPRIKGLWIEHRGKQLFFKFHRYTGCPRKNVPDFGRVFLTLKYVDITQNLCPKLNGYGDNGQRSLKL